MFERIKEWRKYIKNPLQPSNEIKVRVVVDLAESYGSVIKKMENMSAKDHEKIFKTFSRVFEGFNKLIENDTKSKD